MNKSKKLLSLLLVIAVLFSVVAVSTFSVKGDDSATYAFKFRDKDYMSSQFDNKPASLYCDNDGNMYMESNRIQQQYQMLFKVTGSNADLFDDAINEACKYYDGTLGINIFVEDAVNQNGGNCSPEIEIRLLGSTNVNDIIASTGTSKVAPKLPEPTEFNFDVSQYMDTSYNGEIKYVYVIVQCYDWGCAGGTGTNPEVSFTPIYAVTGVSVTQPISTEPPDPNQKTFFKFNKSARQDYNNGASKIEYSADGAEWKTENRATIDNAGYVKLQQINKCNQMQVKYTLSGIEDETANALAVANAEGGSGMVKVRVDLQNCTDPNGNQTIAEIDIELNTTKGYYSESEKPESINVTAWQYSGTSRYYYLDVSKIKHISQIDHFVFRVQNYWYYDTEGKLFDFEAQTGLTDNAAEKAGTALGYTRCKIRPNAVISPMTVCNTATVTNTDYSFSLDGYNKAGCIPADPYAGDPNTNDNADAEVTTTTTTTTTKSNISPTNGTTVAVAPSKSTITSVKLTGKKKAKIAWTASKNAKSYTVFRATSKKGKYTAIKKGLTTRTYTDSTLAEGKTYYYIICATNGVKYTNSAAKGVKVLKYSAKPTLKLSTKSKKLTVKVSKKVTNAVKYEVRYATNSKFKSYKKSTALKTSKTFKATSKKTYYVKARAYTTINGKKYYSKWSSVKKIKVK